jgi:aconitate hydratase 2 / 2-methylisocitrate dehydratase
MLKTYRDHVAERAALGIPPLPLSAKQTGELIELLKNPPKGEEATLVDLITKATELLGTMLGGYNLTPLIDLLDNQACAPIAAEGLKKTLLMFDQFHDVKEKADKGNALAKAVVQSWADAEWFTSRPKCPKASRCRCSKSRARPTPTTCHPRPMPGAAPTSLCMP